MLQRIVSRFVVNSRPFLCQASHLSSETIVPNFDAQTKSENTPASFATLLRNSPFVQMGNPEGKVVVGKVYHVVDDDLYIDFGGKFHCVCNRPRGASGRAYSKGTEVRLRVKKLEVSQKFLGFEKEMSLLEAECILLGLHK